VFAIETGFSKLEFDHKRYVGDFKAKLKDELRQALRAMLRATMVRVPVYTGMARGSLRPLGRFLNEHVPISPVAQRKKMGIREGEALGSVEIDDSTYDISVKINIGVLHYAINEFFNVPLPLKNPTPWESFRVGREAYKRYLRQNLKQNLPRIKKYVSRKRIVLHG
jgi:hypothetical protein